MRTLTRKLATVSALLSLFFSHAQSFEWARGLGGPNVDFGFATATDASGNVYTTGRFETVADFDPGPGLLTLTCTGLTDIYVSKLDAGGKLVWARAFNAQGGGTNAGSAISVDNAGNIYVTGLFSGVTDFDPGPGTYMLTAAGFADAYVMKLDTDGNLIWAKGIGGKKMDEGASIATDGAGSVYVAGRFTETADFDPGPGIFALTTLTNMPNGFICKLDKSGGFIWAKQIASINKGQEMITGYSYMTSLALDGSDNVFVTGEAVGYTDFDPGPATYSTVNNSGFLMKLDASGNFNWVKSFMASIIAVKIDAPGNIIMTGIYGSTFDKCDFDPGPATYTMQEEGNADVFVSKLDPAGKFLWARSIGGKDRDLAGGIALDYYNNIYVAGSFMLTADFESGPGTYTFATNGATDIFISKFDNIGSLVKAWTMGGPGEDFGKGIAAGTGNGKHNVYATGFFAETVDFDPDTSIHNLTASPVGYHDVFVIKLSEKDTTTRKDSIIICEAVADYSLPNAFSPNGDGNNDEFCLQGWDKCTSSFHIMIFDRWGEKVFESDDPAFCWKGIYKEKELDPDVFIYVIRAQSDKNASLDKKGSITLLH